MKKLISIRQLNIAVAAVATAILLVFLLSFSETGTPPRFGTGDQQQSSPEFFIMEASTRHYNDDGRLISTVNSDEVTHIGTTETARLLNPRHISIQPDQTQWVTTAREGIAHIDGERIELMQQVEIVNQRDNTRVKTSAMTVYPEKKIAESKQTVTINSNQGFTRGKGMTANLNSGEITLLSNVRGQYHAVSD